MTLTPDLPAGLPSPVRQGRHADQSPVDSRTSATEDQTTKGCPMNALHEAVWTLDRDTTTVTVVCNAPHQAES